MLGKRDAIFWWASAVFTISLCGFAATARGQSLPIDCRAWGKPERRATLCALLHDDTVKGLRLPAGTLIHFDSTRTLTFFWLTKPARVGTLDLAGARDGPHHAVWPDGAIRSVFLSRAQIIDGVPCRALTVFREIFRGTSRVFFHHNGRLAACRIDHAMTIQARRFATGDRVAFDSTGRLIVSAH